MEENNKYIYPVEELDKIIEQMDKGITPMMSDQMAFEVKLRYKELQNELFDEDDEYEDADLIKQKKIMQKHMEKKKREATKNDVIIIKLTDEQKKQLREDMETSIVRPNPNSPYNLSDDVIFSSEERKKIQQKLSRIKNCYYNQYDYVNAINIIKEAIEYSLANDYPWLSKEEAVQQFNEGKIKFSYCNIPKLYVNFQTQITDPEILKGVVTGEIELRDKSEQPEKKPKKDYKPVSCDYNLISDVDFDEMVKYHTRGYDTPVSHIIRSRSTIYNRYSLPTSNRFGVKTNDQEPILFDWSRDGAGKEYFNLIHGKTYTTNDLMRDINADNDGLLNHVVTTNANEFLNSMKNVRAQDDGYTRPDFISSSLQVNEQALQVEQNILNAIRANNPTPSVLR